MFQSPKHQSSLIFCLSLTLLLSACNDNSLSDSNDDDDTGTPPTVGLSQGELNLNLVQTHNEQPDAQLEADTSREGAIHTQGSLTLISPQTLDVRKSSALSLAFKSLSEGQRHGILLADNPQLDNAIFFQLYGDSNDQGIIQQESFRYTTLGDYQTLSIPIGEFITGNQLTLAMVSEDSLQSTADSYWDDITIDPNDSSNPSPPAPPTTLPTDCTLTSEQQALLDEHNIARSSSRKCGETTYPEAPPLTWSCALGRAAQKHSEDMADNNYFSHTSQDGRDFSTRISNEGYTYSTAGENIAAGNATAAATVQQWLRSDGHCENIMNSNYTEFGGGIGDNINSRYRYYWTGNFATPR